MDDNLHQLRCFGCGSRIAGAQAQPNFRCAVCGDLFEVEYPGWIQREGPNRPNPGALKWLWRERRCSSEALDQSGVWRFRELLPILSSFGNAVSLREGNTPLYHLPRAAKRLGLDQLYAKHQGMNPTGSFKDTGMTAALSAARESVVRAEGEHARQELPGESIAQQGPERGRDQRADDGIDGRRHGNSEAEPVGTLS